MLLSNWKSSWYEFFSVDRRVLSSERLNTDFLDDSDKNRGSMSPNNDGRNVFLWMVFMGFIFVSLVVLERVMEVPQIWLVWSWRWRIWKGGQSGRSTKLDFPLKLTAFWIHNFLPFLKTQFFLWDSQMNDGRNFFVSLILMVLIFVALGLLETFLAVPELGYLFEQQFVISWKNSFWRIKV